MGLEVRTAPLLGEHAEEMLSGLLSYRAARVQQLRAERAAA